VYRVESRMESHCELCSKNAQNISTNVSTIYKALICPIYMHKHWSTNVPAIQVFNSRKS